MRNSYTADMRRFFGVIMECSLGAALLASLLLASASKFDTAGRIYFVLAMGLLALPFVVAAFLYESPANALSPFEVFLSLGFVSLFALSFVFSETKNVGFTELLATASLVAVYLALRASRFHSRRLLFFIALLAMGSAAFGLFYFTTQFEPRVAGPFFDPLKRAAFFPNAYALFLLMTWPIVASFFMKRQRALHAIGLGLVFAALALTYSRGAFLAFLFQLALLLVSLVMVQPRAFLKRAAASRWRAIFAKARALAIVFLCALVFIGIALGMRSQHFPSIAFTERIAVSEIERKTSIGERLDFFRGALALAMEKPLLGYGPMSFGYLYRRMQPEMLAISDHPHNAFLKIAAENGVPATAFAIAFAVFIIVTAASRFEKASFLEQRFALALGISLVGAVAHNMIDYNMNFFGSALLFSIILAFMLNELGADSAVGKSGKNQTLLACAPFVLGALVFAAAAREGLLLVDLRAGADGEARAAYEATWAPRGHFVIAAREAIGFGDELEAKRLLALQRSRNAHDAEALNILSEIAFRERRFDQAAAFSRGAAERDPKNFFNYYKNLLAAESARGNEKEIARLRPLIEELLAEYRILFDGNAHFTVFTGNPFDAAWLADFYGITEAADYFRTETPKRRQEIIEQNRMTWEVPFSFLD